MNKRSVIAVSIAVAFATPLAFAQDRGQSAVHANVNASAAAQVAPPATATPAIPATPAVPATPPTQDAPAVPATPAIPATPAVPPVDRPDTHDPQNQDLPPPPPVQSQGQVNAQAHSSVATRATFAEVDADQDGRISIDEAGDDEGLASGFANMDANDDGYVSAVEYRLAMKGMLPESGDDADDGDDAGED